MSKNSILKKFALIAAGAMILPAFAAADIKMGIILGFTGPIESLTPDMGNSAELAFKEASDSGQLLADKRSVSSVLIQHASMPRPLAPQQKD